MDNGFDQWGGYMEAKISKLRQQYNDVKNIYAQNNLFAGISIYVNGHTNPSADELKRLIMINGGIYHHYESSDTTYIIASNLPDVKVRNMKLDRTISAQWVVDCIKENRILDYTYYLLYTNRKSTQPKLKWVQQNNDKKIKFDGRGDCKVDSSIVKCTESILSSPKRSIKNDLELKLVAAESTTTTLSTVIEEDENALQKALNVLHNKLKRSDVGEKCHKQHEQMEFNSNVQTNTKITHHHLTTMAERDFLDEFQQNSRLHQISTLASRLKQHINNLRSEQNCIERTVLSEPLQKLVNKVRNENRSILSLKEIDDFDCAKLYIMHIDMDCFFISVGLRKQPHLRYLPTVVTHRTVVGANSEMSMAEVACASYEARKYGIKNGMLLGEAWSLCPTLKVMPYDFDGYVEVAFALYNTIAQYTLDIEAVSCDELYVNITDILKIGKITAMEFMTVVRAEVFDRTNCCCSAGVGSNKLQARLATKKAKPNGQFHLDSKDDVMKFLSTLPIKDLPGIGYVTSAILQNAGLNVCGDIMNNKCTEKDLQKLIGASNGKMLYNYCQGIDNRQLEYEYVPNSISVEMNYGIRYDSVEQVENALYSLSTKVHEKLLNIKRKAKCLILKIMIRAKTAPVEAAKYMGHGLCDTKRKSLTLLEYTDDLDMIFNNIKKLMQQLNIEPNELRGLGIQLSKLSNTAAITKSTNTNKQLQTNTIDNMFQKLKQKETFGEKMKVEKVLDKYNSTGCQTITEKRTGGNMTIANNKRRGNKKKRNTIDKIFQKQLCQETNTNTKITASNSNINTTIIECDKISPSYDIEREFLTKNLDNIFLKTDCQQLLLNWLKQQQMEEPNQYDIDLLCYMAKDVIRNHDMDLDKLYDALIYLVNVLNSFDTFSSSSSSEWQQSRCAWHLMFKHLLKTVNIEIMTKFNGRSLHMIEELQCKKCVQID